MPARSFTTSSIISYRYAFQKQEIDQEFWEGGISFEYRIEDPRLGKFFKIDPLNKHYPDYSPYAFSRNRPIDKIELEGLQTGNNSQPGQNENGIYTSAIDNTAIATTPDIFNLLDLSTVDPVQGTPTIIGPTQEKTELVKKLQKQQEYQENRMKQIYANPQDLGQPGTSALIGWGIAEGVTWEYIGFKAADLFKYGVEAYESFRFGSAAASATSATTKAIASSTQSSSPLFEYYKNMARTLDVSTGIDEAVFYSGPGNKLKATQFAIENGRKTIEMTNGGSWMESQDLFGVASPLTQEEAYEVWKILSERYAQNASGTINAFVTGANPNGVFTTIEKPALQSNILVNEIVVK